MYTEEMVRSIQRVAQTRPDRLREQYPTLTPGEKDALLRGFHPDHREDARRKIRAGPSAGDSMPHAIADCLEARSIIDENALDPTRPDQVTDILVIGGGGGGVAAALTAHQLGAGVLLVTKLRLGDANTMMAQGGMQAATRPGDSPAIHYLDIMGGGGFTNRPELVRALTLDGPGIVHWLEDLGCMFKKEADGTLMTIHGGGTSRKRTLFAGDYTGAEIMRTLRDELRNYPVPVVEFCAAVELLLDTEGRCAGAVVKNMDTGRLQVVHARATILATGGSGRLHTGGFPTTNHYGATGDGLVMAYRAGCRLRYLDATQFHPTGVAHPEQILGQLVTEKIRGLGAQLVNDRREQFVNPLETRDAVASAIIRECDARGLGFVTGTGQPGVWLDSPMIDLISGPGTVRAQLPAMYRQYGRFGIDMSEDPILVYPTLHYQNGGITIDEFGRSPDVPNLYMAGEAAGGVHGRNRLGGNSLLDVLVFGRRAGRHAAQQLENLQTGTATLDHVQRYREELEAAGLGDRVSPVLLPRYTRS